MPSRSIDPPLPVDLRLSLRPVRRGRGDPCMRFAADGVWRATRTPDGPATLHLRPDDGRIEAEAWGPGADWALEHAPGLVGADDSLDGFEPDHRVVRELHRRLPGLRLVRTGAVVEALVPTVCEQKVTGFEARRSYHQLVFRYGEPAPGPGGLMLPPDPELLAGAPSYDLHVLGLERKRADTVKRVCAQAGRLDALAAGSPAAAATRLTSIMGIGPWTAAEVGAVALGDPDAVSVGDYHLPNSICFALVGEQRGTDERMLELLEPFAGHRSRVVRLVEAAGIHAPRRGPRLAPRNIRSI